MAKGHLILRLIRDPVGMTALSAPQWEDVLGQARGHALLPPLARLAETHGVLTQLPRAVRWEFESTLALVAYNRRQNLWEVDRIHAACRALDVPIIFLKGAAYVLGDFELGTMRIASDTDILVPKRSLAEVEAALRQADWVSQKVSAYDQAYYRQWMHELPPMMHRHRNTIIDVHHTLLPPTGRVHPDPEAIIEMAQMSEGAALIPCPADLLVHAALHMAQDGDFAGRLRDLVDFDSLAREVLRGPADWERLVQRTELHGASRAMAALLHLSQKLMDLPVPPEVPRALGPAPLTVRLCAPAAMMPWRQRQIPLRVRVARLLLYMRSHWLRMPPLMLARHLATKFWLNRFGGAAAAPQAVR